MVEIMSYYSYSGETPKEPKNLPIGANVEYTFYIRKDDKLRIEGDMSGLIFNGRFVPQEMSFLVEGINRWLMDTGRKERVGVAVQNISKGDVFESLMKELNWSGVDENRRSILRQLIDAGWRKVL